MKKIVVTGTRGIPNILGGVETHCEELYTRLAAHGFNITLIRRTCYVKDNLSEYKGVKLVNLQTVKKKSFESIIHTIQAVWVAKFRLRADILHIHAIGPALITPLARLLGLKVVFTHHSLNYDHEKWNRLAKFMLRLGEKMGIKYANEVIVISNVINSMIKEKYKRMDIHLIYNGVPEPDFIVDTNYLDSLGIMPNKYLLAMGRFAPEKNFHQLINAFVALTNKHNCQLVLAGDPDFEDAYARELKNLAHKSGIILTGFIKGEKLHALLSHARAFVLPSLHEGLPISLLEAMSYNLPVLVSDIPANLAVGLPQDSYFPVGNEQKLTEKLKKIVEEMPEKCKYPLENYQWEHIAQQTIKVYEKI